MKNGTVSQIESCLKERIFQTKRLLSIQLDILEAIDRSIEINEIADKLAKLEAIEKICFDLDITFLNAFEAFQRELKVPSLDKLSDEQKQLFRTSQGLIETIDILKDHEGHQNELITPLKQKVNRAKAEGIKISIAHNAYKKVKK